MNDFSGFTLSFPKELGIPDQFVPMDVTKGPVKIGSGMTMTISEEDSVFEQWKWAMSWIKYHDERRTVDVIERELNHALLWEDYEKAAKLRDELKKKNI